MTIASDLLLPEWSRFQTGAPGHTNIEFVLEAPSSGTIDCGADSSYSFEVPEVARFAVSGGNRVAVSPFPGAHEREVRLFLLGSAWGALCYGRGLLPLHAGVVRVGEGAVAFCGPSGAGKSSLVAHLLERGHALIGDDLCVCDFPDAAPPAVWPAATRLKLWDETLDALGWSSDNLQRDHFRGDKFHVAWDGEIAPQEPVPLRAIYILEWGEPELHRLRGMHTLTSLVEAATYRGEMIASAEQQAAHWSRCARLAEQVPIWTFKRPRDWGRNAAALELLAREWEDFAAPTESV